MVVFQYRYIMQRKTRATSAYFNVSNPRLLIVHWLSPRRENIPCARGLK